MLAITKEDLPLFQKIAERERCLFAVVGTATESQQFNIGGWCKTTSGRFAFARISGNYAAVNT